MAKRGKTAAEETTGPPSDAEMAALLGDAWLPFQALVRRDGKGTSEWRRYSRNSPWVLKVSQRTRTLFYAQPGARGLKVTVVLGPRAVQAALAGQVSTVLHAAITGAKVYPEGRPVSVVVKKPSDLAKVEELVAVKLEPLTPGTSKPAKTTKARKKQK